MLNATWAMTKACRRRSRPTSGASFFKPDRTSAFDASSAGASPDSSAATSESPAVNAITRPSRVSDSATGNGSVGSRETSTDVITSRQQETGRSAKHEQQHRFGEQLPDESCASGANREAQRHLLAPGSRARKQNARDVGARDDQHERHDHRQQRDEGDDRSAVSRNGRARPAAVTRSGDSVPGTRVRASGRSRPSRRRLETSRRPVSIVRRSGIRRTARSVSVAAPRGVDGAQPCPSAPTRPARGRPCR